METTKFLYKILLFYKFTEKKFCHVAKLHYICRQILLAMACLSPLNIINPTVSYAPAYDAVDIQVPCGHCLSCRQNMQNQWATRIYAEWLANKELGGLTAFATLTYNNANLPIYTDPAYNFQESVFSHAHITAFLKKLRMYIFRRFRINGFRYIIFPEYGSQSTRRPHYHALLFFPPGISDFSIRALIRKAWIYGFVGFCRPERGGAFVNSPKALLYCSKYCAKDLNFFGKKSIIDYLTQIKGDEERKKLFSQHVPRHYQSKGFGKSVLLRYLHADKLEDAITKGVRFEGLEGAYALPDYIFRTSCYEVNNYGVRVVSAEGAKILSLRDKYLLRMKAQKMYHDITFLGLSSISTNKDIFEVTKGKFNNALDLHEHLVQLLDGRNTYDLCVYAKYYRGRSYEYNAMYEFNVNPQNADLYTLIDAAESLRWFALNRRNKFRQVPEGEKGILRGSNYRKAPRYLIAQNNLFDNLPCFAGFNEILDLYNKLVACRKSNNLQIEEHNNNLAKELRDKFYFSLTPV